MLEVAQYISAVFLLFVFMEILFHFPIKTTEYWDNDDYENK